MCFRILRRIFEMSSFNIGFVTSYAENAYPGASFEWISVLADEINEAAGMVGISPGAIAGIMAEERKDYGKSLLRSWIGDFIAEYEVDLPELDNLENFNDRPEDEFQEFIASVIIPKVRDHSSWESELAAVNALYSDINYKPSLHEQLQHPSFIDVGYGNFRIRKAVHLMENNPVLSAQLGLDKYTNDYALLVNNMLDPDSDVTAKLYAMYLIEAENWYKANSAYGSNWDSLPVEFKDALLVTFVNLGQTQMENLRNEKESKNDALGYQPVPALGTGGGINHLVNSASIGDALGLSGYGAKVSAISGIESLAQTQTLEGLAARYALLNLRPVILPNIDYSTVNQQHELDLYNETTKLGELTPSWIADRALFLNAKGIYDLSGREDNIVDGNGISNSIINLKDVNLDIHLTLQPSVISSDTDIKTFSFGGRLNDVLIGDNGNDRIYGLGGDDKLNGLKGHDVLDGGAGVDELTGGEGADVLKGGQGKDVYVFDGNFGRDIVIDSDGSGTIAIDGITLSSVKQTVKDGIAHRDSTNTVEVIKFDEGGSTSLLVTSLTNRDNSIHIKNWKEGELGINLAEFEPEEVASVKHVSGTGANDALYAERGKYLDDRGMEQIGNYVASEIHGGEGKDYIAGSYGADRLYGDGGNDWITAESIHFIIPEDPLPSTRGDDYIDGGEGDDVITGRAWSGAEWHGGDGKDMLLANVHMNIGETQADINNDNKSDDIVRWSDLLNHLISGFKIYEELQGDINLYTMSAWAGVEPGTYTGNSALGNGWTYEFVFTDPEPLHDPAETKGSGISLYSYIKASKNSEFNYSNPNVNDYNYCMSLCLKASQQKVLSIQPTLIYLVIRAMICS
jgi:Ca2+-binding RTX toxin-like protein